jgi:transporter family-2 protein
MSNQFLYSVIMLMAGVGIPIMAAMNARVGSALASPQAAVLLLLAVACITMTAYTLAAGWPKLQTPQLPKYYYLAGILFIFYILSITWIAPRFGIGNAVFFVLLGQIVSAALIDHYGLFGATQTPVDRTRAAGLLLMVVAVFLSVRR